MIYCLLFDPVQLFARFTEAGMEKNCRAFYEFKLEELKSVESK
jgi:hypothetical protein